MSGDIGRSGTPILREPNTRYAAGCRIDHIVIESTYGDHAARGWVRDRLRQTLRALADGGKVLVPAFAVGRTQQLVHHLRALTAESELADVPPVIDGRMGI